ncbi:MAG TPA: hypothetical protein VMZ29_16375 [Candidatus Bathyarchaeia archaeon]|nr:hypothetical protein [Candidatus Bathyarchaeia archaeon]
MSKEKRNVGRPRKYETQSERQKAYHERKKQKMEKLEEKIKVLEKEKLFSSDDKIEVFEDVEFKDIPSFNWKKFTPSEIALMGAQDLESLIEEFQERIHEHASFDISLENITLGIISKNYLASKNDPSLEKIEQINREINRNIKNLEERMQQQTLLYLMEAELANRERLDSRKTKLDLFEAKIDELEKEVKKDKVKIEKKVEQ